MDSEVEITLSDENEAGWAILNPLGDLIGFGATQMSGEPVAIWSAMPHILLVMQAQDEPVTLTLTSTHPLRPFTDPDGTQPLSLGQTVTGNLDYPGDVDTFTLELTAGQAVSLTVRSMMNDPFLSVDFPDALAMQIGVDDDSEGGLFSHDARLIYKPIVDGPHTLTIEDSWGVNTGGYIVTTETASEDVDPALIVEPPVPEKCLASTEAPMPLTTYQSDQYPITLDRPTAWEVLPGQENLYTVAFNDDPNGLLIVEEDLSQYDLDVTDLEEYVELILEIVSQNSKIKLLDSKYWLTADNELFMRLEFRAVELGQLVRISRLVYLHEGAIGFSASYLAPAEEYDTLAATIEQSFCSLQITQ